jgi:hypothetical protein
MSPQHIRLYFVLLTALLSSCASKLDYKDVMVGKIVGKPSIQWETPNRFVLHPHRAQPFRFIRYNGDIIIPQDLRTDGGSIPRVLWGYDGFSPWQFTPAYLVHDWIYEAKRRSLPPNTTRSGIYRANGITVPYTRAEADQIMAEVIKTQMRDPNFNTVESPWHLEKIHWAVQRYGQDAWNGHPDPVSHEEAGPSVTAADLLPLHWLNPIRMELQSQVLRGPKTAEPKKPETKKVHPKKAEPNKPTAKR